MIHRASYTRWPSIACLGLVLVAVGCQSNGAVRAPWSRSRTPDRAEALASQEGAPRGSGSRPTVPYDPLLGDPAGQPVAPLANDAGLPEANVTTLPPASDERVRDIDPAPTLATADPPREPLFDSGAGPGPATTRPANTTEMPTTQPASSTVPADGAIDYAIIRQRLDRAGATNFRLETDERTREAVFQAAVPYPQEPDRMRVFKARDPDEGRAMLAVTEAVEAWVAGQGN